MGRIALRPLYDVIMRGGGGIDGRARWAIEGWARLLPDLAPRIKRPVGRTVDVRIYSDACATDGGMAAASLFSRSAGDFTVVLTGNAEPLLLEGIADTDEISGLEMFAAASAVVALGEQSSG